MLVSGATGEAWTLDLRGHSAMLYQLSYDRHVSDYINIQSLIIALPAMSRYTKI